jgi:putative transposase
MPRTARLVIPGVPCHVVHRGNRRQPIFLGDGDRALYLALLAEESARVRLALWGWCLMESEVRLLAVPGDAEALARAIGLAHRRFAQAMNRRHGWSGHLFEGRFQSCALDPRHAAACLLDIESAPVRAGLAAAAEEWPWSSASARARGDALLAPGAPPPRSEPPAETELEAIRRATLTGRPCGDVEWVRGLERMTGLTLVKRPRGRPRREPAPAAPLPMTGWSLPVELL